MLEVRAFSAEPPSGPARKMSHRPHLRAWSGFAGLQRAAFSLLALLASAWVAADAAPAPRPVSPPVAIEIRSVPIEAFDPRDPALRRFGSLQFRGGLVLTSPYKNFGGLSALHMATDGASFLSLSDKGRWFKGRITYDGTRPAGIADAQMAPMLGADGRPLASRGWYDTESLTENEGALYVGIERVHRIVRFDASAGLTARAEEIETPPEMRALPSNKGLEALVFVPRGRPLGGTLLAFSERGLDGQGNLRAWLVGGPSPGTFSVKRDQDFDISDAALLPSGDLLILERKFSWFSGIAIRIRRLALANVRPDALVDGPTLFQADFGYQVDNMEGLGVHTDAEGEIVLTLISDDNFSILQRTLLLQFTLLSE